MSGSSIRDFLLRAMMPADRFALMEDYELHFRLDGGIGVPACEKDGMLSI